MARNDKSFLQLESIEELKGRVYEAADILCKGSPKRSREVALRQ